MEDWGGAPVTVVSDTKYVYDGWRVIMELDALNDDQMTRQYAWGWTLPARSGR
jgi:hypothetical protein